MNNNITAWDIVTTDHGEKPQGNVPARFVIRATNKQTGRVVYGLGNTEREAREDAYRHMAQGIKA